MKTNNINEELMPGIRYELRYIIPTSKTVPALFSESPEFQLMPKVFATGFLVGLIEWACILSINPYIAWPVEQTVGTHINVSHSAATPPEMEVRAKVRLIKVEGRRLIFDVEVFDQFDLIARGTHERVIIHSEKFSRKAMEKGKSGRSYNESDT